MRKTRRIEEAVVLGTGTTRTDNITLSVDFAEGSTPRDVHVECDGERKILSIEEVLRVAEGIKRAGWVPSGRLVCVDHGLVALDEFHFGCEVCGVPLPDRKLRALESIAAEVAS
jgi:hypothetical protein